VPSTPKFDTVIEILPTVVYFVLSSVVVLLKCCASVAMRGRKKRKEKTIRISGLIFIRIIKDLAKNHDSMYRFLVESQCSFQRKLKDNNSVIRIL
jgi:hypothetical protein